jgi:hypothetical protein
MSARGRWGGHLSSSQPSKSMKVSSNSSRDTSRSRKYSESPSTSLDLGDTRPAATGSTPPPRHCRADKHKHTNITATSHIRESLGMCDGWQRWCRCVARASSVMWRDMGCTIAYHVKTVDVTPSPYFATAVISACRDLMARGQGASAECATHGHPPFYPYPTQAAVAQSAPAAR